MIYMHDRERPPIGRTSETNMKLGSVVFMNPQSNRVQPRNRKAFRTLGIIIEAFSYGLMLSLILLAGYSTDNHSQWQHLQ